MKTRIGLGTVQFGLAYGINNQEGQISIDGVNTILDRCYSEGIEVIDTAQEYGESEDRLGRFFINKKFGKVISKFRIKTNDLPMRSNLENSLRKLNLPSLYAFMYHDFNDYQLNKETYNELIELKKEGRIQHIGFSLYYPYQLEEIIHLENFDIVQVPYNIFDKRFEPYFKVLKDKGVLIHTRSTFLQGLFFKELDQVDSYFQPIQHQLIKIHEICVEYQISIGVLALQFVLMNKYIDNVILGVDSEKNLIELLNWQNNSLEPRIYGILNDEITIEDESYLLPFNWKLGEK